ncbi:MAG: metal-dependent hydrolase [Pseudomonadota bacterium]
MRAMPGFAVHLGASAALGAAGASLALVWQGVDASAAVMIGLAGLTGGLAPDLDADKSRPLRLAGGLMSLIIALGLGHQLIIGGNTSRTAVLIGAGAALAFYLLGLRIFKALTRHRGMFHSLPLALTYGLALAAVLSPLGPAAALMAAGSGTAGALSHLLLDAMFSLSVKPLKLWSKKLWPSLLAWFCLAGAAFWAWVKLGRALY